MEHQPPVDGEGFPAVGTCSNVQRTHCRDQENGEVATSNVIMVRDSSKSLNLPILSLNNGLSQGSLSRTYTLSRDEQFLSGLTRNNRMSVRLRPRRLVYHGTAAPLLQKYVYLQRGQPVSTVLKPRLGSDPTASILPCEPYKAEPFFRIPAKCLPASHTEQPTRDPKVVCISIWEEFFFGQSVLDGHGADTEKKTGITEHIRAFLNRYFSRTFVDVLLYTIYFITIIASCFYYNMFWELASYLLLVDHLNLHILSYKKGIEVDFTGSLFQGPIYVFTRNWWCQHCEQKERAKVVLRLMKKMKADILMYQKTTNATSQVDKDK